MRARKSIQSLELDGLCVSFEGQPPLFTNVSFIMPKSKAVWIRSPGKGRGKSTLLRILCGLMAPDVGRYLINGEDVCEMSFEEFLPYRINIGYGFDMGGLLNNKTLFENLMLPLLYHNILEPGEAAERVNEVVDWFGIQHIKDLRPFAVSGSHRKLVCVIRAFMHWPQVVFLDDPLTGLKQENLNDLFHFVDESFASRGLKQIFFTSEPDDLAVKYNADELLIMEDWFMIREAEARSA